MFSEALGILAGLGSLGGLISVIVNLLKRFNVVKDGTSDKWVKGLNLLAFIGVSATLLFNVHVDWNAVNLLLGFIVTALGYLLQLLSSKLAYKLTKGIPVIGYSFSDQKSE
jgi:hypothetical protein